MDMQLITRGNACMLIHYILTVQPTQSAKLRIKNTTSAILVEKHKNILKKPAKKNTHTRHKEKKIKIGASI